MFKHFSKLLFCYFIVGISCVYASETIQPAITATISTDSLINYQAYAPANKKVINAALALTKQNLTYQYGSANPGNGGMDCSGTIFYLLQQLNIKDAPRQANLIYLWVGKNIHSVHADNFSAPEFSELKPGDLLFWTGTYAVKRKPPITHVMIYIGENQQHQRLMVGASDGRTYLDKKMRGVSVFDFKLHSINAASQFIGYSCIPHVTCAE